MPRLRKTSRKPRKAVTEATNASPARTTKHVALLVETSRTFGRDILTGVNRYIAEHGHW